MSDTIRRGAHKVYPVPIRSGIREKYPDYDHDDFVAYKCELCEIRLSGIERFVDLTLRERSCPPEVPGVDE